MDIAAVVVAVLLGGVALFQLALVIGAPWGEHAYGGRADVVEGRLVGKFRVMSGAAVPILVFACAVVLSQAMMVTWFGSGGWVRVSTWVVFGYLVLNTAGNLASSSRVEKYVMGTMTAAAAIATLIVALGG